MFLLSDSTQFRLLQVFLVLDDDRIVTPRRAVVVGSLMGGVALHTLADVLVVTAVLHLKDETTTATDELSHSPPPRMGRYDRPARR